MSLRCRCLALLLALAGLQGPAFAGTSTHAPSGPLTLPGQTAPLPLLRLAPVNVDDAVIAVAAPPTVLVPDIGLDVGLRRIVDVAPAPAAAMSGFGPRDFVDDVALIPWETAAVVGSTLAIGFFDWDWGSASFHSDSEGFFGKRTTSGGMDKLGHAFGSYNLADLFARRIARQSGNMQQAALTGSLMSYGVMTMVEVFDGFSSEHGFAPEDMVMNTIGVTFSYLRNTIPGLREKLDFRLEYVPSGYDGGFSPHSDYAGQKYVMALKLAGFEQFEETPLRFLELHAGYFTEGFNNAEAKDRGIDEERHLYFGVGLNLEQALFGFEQPGERRLKTYAREFFQRVQVPYTYATYDGSAYRY